MLNTYVSAMSLHCAKSLPNARPGGRFGGLLDYFWGSLGVEGPSGAFLLRSRKNDQQKVLATVMRERSGSALRNHQRIGTSSLGPQAWTSIPGPQDQGPETMDWVEERGLHQQPFTLCAEARWRIKG